MCLACGMTGLAAGYAIGIVGDAVSICQQVRRVTTDAFANIISVFERIFTNQESSCLWF